MFEKVNPSHPDKVADRIAGAMVDYAYKESDNPKIAVEVLIGHGVCNIIAETSVHIPDEIIKGIVNRIAGELEVNYTEVAQNEHLADNQSNGIKCGDNGIFKGVPITNEEKLLSEWVRNYYSKFPYDGKYVIDAASGKLIICQSNVDTYGLREFVKKVSTALDDDLNVIVNPLGNWTGGIDVDSGATNRKLGSDMAQSVTGGGLHGKDLSKADVSVNIYAWLEAQRTGKPIELFCAIGDEYVNGIPYSEIVEIASYYIKNLGGFEKFAEWGLV